MDTKELKGLPTMGEEDVVKIWKMNFGFKNDMTAESLTIEVDGTGKRKAIVNPAKAKQAWLIHGIYESAKLGIPVIKDVAGGLTDPEKNLRTRIIRNCEQDLMEKIYDEIQVLNNPKKENEDEINTVKND